MFIAMGVSRFKTAEILLKHGVGPGRLAATTKKFFFFIFEKMKKRKFFENLILARDFSATRRRIATGQKATKRAFNRD